MNRLIARTRARRKRKKKGSHLGPRWKAAFRLSRNKDHCGEISRLRDEIRNKAHLGVAGWRDLSCEGRPFLVDACPRIVTPAYAKPRPRIRREAVYPSESPLTRRPSLPSSQMRFFVFAVVAAASRLAVMYLVTDRIFDVLRGEKPQRCEGMLRPRLKRLTRTR